jgi:hypothetical protein
MGRSAEAREEEVVTEEEAAEEEVEEEASPGPPLPAEPKKERLLREAAAAVLSAPARRDWAPLMMRQGALARDGEEMWPRHWFRCDDGPEAIGKVCEKNVFCFLVLFWFFIYTFFIILINGARVESEKTRQKNRHKKKRAQYMYK